MNPDKAREYFSAHYEGTLDRGLKLSLERKFDTDSSLRLEYEDFCRAMRSLDGLAAEVPAPPFDLHDRISARLDKHVWEQKRRSSSGFLSLWKSMALGGLATVAIVAAIMQLQSRGSVSGAGFNLPDSPGQMQLQLDGDSLVFQYHSEGKQRVVIRAEDGTVLQDRTLEDEVLRSPLASRLQRAALIRIEIENRAEAIFVAVPGSRFEAAETGTGSLAEMARAAAGHYRVPIMLTALDPDAAVAWSFKSREAYEAIQGALRNTRCQVDRRANGVIVIGQK